MKRCGCVCVRVLDRSLLPAFSFTVRLLPSSVQRKITGAHFLCIIIYTESTISHTICLPSLKDKHSSTLTISLITQHTTRMSKHHHISTNHFVNDLVFIVYLLISISVYVRFRFFFGCDDGLGDVRCEW